MEKNIPDEVRKQIEEKYPKTFMNTGIWQDDNTYQRKRDAAEFGYSLRSTQLSEAKAEIEKLKNHYRMEVIRRNMLIEKLVKTGAMLMDGNKEAQEKEWTSFQTTYNL